MNDSMVDSLNDQRHTMESLEMPHPRAVGSPLPRGIDGRVQMAQNYNDIPRLAPIPSPDPGITLEDEPVRLKSVQSQPAAQADQAEPVRLAPPPSPGPALVSHSAPTPAAAPGPVIAAEPAPPPPASPGPVLAAQSAPPAPASPGPALVSQSKAPTPAGPPSGFQRAVGALRVALPFVQRILPLLDGNFTTAVSNVLTPPPPPAPPAPKVNLAPIEEGLADLNTKHLELRERIAEQNSSLKRVEDQLEMVREATDRNTLEQQELLEDLKSVGNKINVVAAIAIGLLAISLLVNVALFMHIQRVLP